MVAKFQLTVGTNLNIITHIRYEINLSKYCHTEMECSVKCLLTNNSVFLKQSTRIANRFSHVQCVVTLLQLLFFIFEHSRPLSLLFHHFKNLAFGIIDWKSQDQA